MPSKVPPLTLESRRSLATLFEELLEIADSLATSCRKQNWSEVDDLVPSVKSYVRSIKEEIPEGLAKAQVTQLDAHAQFIETFTRRRDRWYVLSNARSIRPDLRRLGSTVGIGGMAELRAPIEALPIGNERDLLEESLRCLEAESPRAAVVLAVCALENLLRGFYQTKRGQDPKRMEFWKVIDEVAKMGGLTDPERVLLDQCRGFRNFAAHPSEYKYTEGDAQGIVRLATEQVRKWTQARP